jgi:2',3'-cyclic-nucleotide 2'-phosphodiesterase/3'-nucleotidase
MDDVPLFTLRSGTGRAHLRLMQTTDLHMNVFPYDYYADRALDTVGLARTAGLIRQQRTGAANTMLFDSGDFLQGNPLGDYIAQDRGLRQGELHPIIAAMNAVGYDAVTLGNHDFNYGPEFLLKALRGAQFAVVSANVVVRRGDGPLADTPFVPPVALLDRVLNCSDGQRRPIRVGVIGLAPPQIVAWDCKALQDHVATRDIVETARAWVPHLRAQGADLVIALAHTGIGAAEHTPGQENAALPLARVEGIDALLIGHNHLVFPGPGVPPREGVDAELGRLHDKPAVMAGFWGSHLGVIDLALEHRNGHWKLCESRCEALPVFRRNSDHSVTPLVAPAPDVLASAEADHAAALRYIRRPVGHSTAPMHSYFALLATDPCSHVVAAAQRWHVAQALKGTALAALPLLSAAAPFKTGGRGGPEYFTDVPAGDVALRNIADLYHFPNTIRALRMTGAELHGWLERSAGVFNTLTPGGQDQVLVNPDAPGYNFDVIDGVRFEIDLTQPARYDPGGSLRAPQARRIHNLCWRGRPLDPAASFVVATNNYRAAGGGDFPGTGPGKIVLEGRETNRDIILRFVAQQGTLRPRAASGWRFRAMPGTTVLFETGPGAARYLAEVTGYRIEPLGTGANGFARYRVWL